MAKIFDIIEYPREMKDEIVHRFPEVGIGDYRIGTEVIVRPDQIAVFFRGGKALDVFRGGRHTLTTTNISGIINSISKDFNSRTSFESEVFFVNMSEFGNEKWGTPTPILIGNPKIGFIFIEGWGIFSFRVLEPRIFIEKMIRIAGHRTSDIHERLRSQLRLVIDDSLNELCEENNLQMAAEIIRFRKELSIKVIGKLKTYFDNWGLHLDEFLVEGLRISSNVSQLLQDAGLHMTPNPVNNSAVPIDDNFIFVIMSFDKSLDPVYHSFKKAASIVGLDAQRVSDQLGDYRITDKIIENIRKAFLVIADLSLERPNVYFELGYARGLGKTIIETALEGTNLHFDIKDWTCIFYSMSDQEGLIHSLKLRFEHELAKNKNST